MTRTSAILTHIAAEFSIPVEILLGRSRAKHISIARQTAMFLTRELTGHSLPRIARDMNRRDHTTILCGIARTIERAREPAFVERIDRVRVGLLRGETA